MLHTDWQEREEEDPQHQQRDEGECVRELDEDDDLMALAQAVKEDGRVTTGLVDDRSAGSGADPIDYAATFDGADPANSNHPVFRTRRVAYAKKARRAHLSVVPDAQSEDNSAERQDTDTESD